MWSITSVDPEALARSIVATGLGSMIGEVFRTILAPAHPVARWLRTLPGTVATTTSGALQPERGTAVISPALRRETRPERLRTTGQKRCTATTTSRGDASRCP